MGIFSKKNKAPTKKVTTILDGFANVFTLFSGDKLTSDVFLSAAQTNATHRGKLKLMHMLKDQEQLDYKRILQLRPNPTMTITDFLETMSINYDTYNNAFAFIERDGTGKIVGLWNINPGQMQIGVGPSGTIYCRFFYQQEQYTVPYSEIIHIKKQVTQNEIFGDKNSAINQLLEIINTNYQGIENAIKTSGILQYLLHYDEYVSDADLKKKEKKFTEQFLNPLSKKQGAVKATDKAFTVERIEAAKQIYSNFAEQKLYATQVYNFLGVNEKIINGTNTDSEMIAYYERSVDSFALKLSQELTYKFFNNNQLSYDNKIVARDDRLAFLSMPMRIEIARLARENGILTKGAFADLLYLPIDNAIRNEMMAVSQNYIDGEKKKEDGGKEADENKEPESNGESKSDNKEK